MRASCAYVGIINDCFHSEMISPFPPKILDYVKKCEKLNQNLNR